MTPGIHVGNDQLRCPTVGDESVLQLVTNENRHESIYGSCQYRVTVVVEKDYYWRVITEAELRSFFHLVIGVVARQIGTTFAPVYFTYRPSWSGLAPT